MRELALFAGVGGGLLASRLLGWKTVCAVETNRYCQDILLQRQRDGHLDLFPVWDDIKTFDGKPWQGQVDVVTGGFPCQDISSAGKGQGLSGARSGLVFEMLRIIGEVRPKFVFAENSPLLRTRGLGEILYQLDRLGYDARWGVLGARHVGANHGRKRTWIAAHTNNRGERTQPHNAEMGGAQTIEEVVKKPSDTNRLRSPSGGLHGRAKKEESNAYEPVQLCGQRGDISWWDIPRFAGMDDGMANRVERVEATGNGQVPAVAAIAWEILGGEE